MFIRFIEHSCSFVGRTHIWKLQPHSLLCSALLLISYQWDDLLSPTKAAAFQQFLLTVICLFVVVLYGCLRFEKWKIFSWLFALCYVLLNICSVISLHLSVVKYCEIVRRYQGLPCDFCLLLAPSSSKYFFALLHY